MGLKKHWAKEDDTDVTSDLADHNGGIGNAVITAIGIWRESWMMEVTIDSLV